MIPYGRQNISQADIDAVVEVLRSNFLTQGPVVPRFEQMMAQRVSAKNGVAVNSATSALHIACAALGLGPDDLLWTSPITFVASANCGRYCGAEVDFVDIDPEFFNMCSDALEAKLSVAERDGKLPKGIVPVHMCGQSPDMARIAELAERYGVRIVEDASHAVDGGYPGMVERTRSAVMSKRGVRRWGAAEIRPCPASKDAIHTIGGCSDQIWQTLRTASGG